MNSNLWDKVWIRLKDLYGMNPSIRIVKRFESEKILMKNSNLIEHFEFLSELADYSKQICSHISLREEVGNSFVAWLLGATDVNPLEPHYLCKNCKTVEFRSDVRNGWDLLPKKCSCGHMMYSDGHSLPCERTLVKLSKRPDFEINMSPELLPEAEKRLREYFAAEAQVARVHMTGDIDFFILLDKDESMPPTVITWREHTQHYADKPHYTFSKSWQAHAVQELCRITRSTPDSINFLSEEIIAAFENADIPEVLLSNRSILPFLQQIKPKCFSHILKAEGLRCATGAWKNNQESLWESGTLTTDALIAFREDVYDTIMEAIKSSEDVESSFALSIMERTYMGRFYSKGIPPEMERILQELNIPAWYANTLKKMKYLYPRAQSISCLQLEMMLMWFYLHEKELFYQYAKRSYM